MGQANIKLIGFDVYLFLCVIGFEYAFYLIRFSFMFHRYFSDNCSFAVAGRSLCIHTPLFKVYFCTGLVPG